MLESFKAVLDNEREAEKIRLEAREQAEKIEKEAQEKAVKYTERLTEKQLLKRNVNQSKSRNRRRLTPNLKHRFFLAAQKNRKRKFG